MESDSVAAWFPAQAVEELQPGPEVREVTLRQAIFQRFREVSSCLFT
jgi:hypothetical protein